MYRRGSTCPGNRRGNLQSGRLFHAIFVSKTGGDENLLKKLAKPAKPFRTGKKLKPKKQ